MRAPPSELLVAAAARRLSVHTHRGVYTAPKVLTAAQRLARCGAAAARVIGQPRHVGLKPSLIRASSPSTAYPTSSFPRRVRVLFVFGGAARCVYTSGDARARDLHGDDVDEDVVSRDGCASAVVRCRLLVLGLIGESIVHRL